MDFLSQIDPEVSHALEVEKRRQRQTINLIASENYASKAVLEAQGSFLTCKYAEGYPQHRYYGGCENMDVIEGLAIQRARDLYHAQHANVQAHSGAQANMAAYYAMLKYGDTVMAMSLAHGGHLTHGDRASFSGKSYNFVPYGLNRETERIDYQEVQRLALEHRPRLIVAGASAYPRIIDFERFRQIADLVGARLMVDIAHIAGIVAELAPLFDKAIVTRSIHPRSMATAPIVAELRRHGLEAQETEDVSIALPLALSLAGEKDLICVTGSLFVVAGAIEQAKYFVRR